MEREEERGRGLDWMGEGEGVFIEAWMGWDGMRWDAKRSYPSASAPYPSMERDRETEREGERETETENKKLDKQHLVIYRAL